MRQKFALCAIALLLAGGTARAAEQVTVDAATAAVDLKLVLAVDASGSVDEREFALQMAGIASAFRDETVVAAIGSGPLGRIAVTVALWAEANRPKHALAWHIVSDAAGATAFADAVARTPRSIPGGGTGIGKAIMFAIGLLRDNALTAPRRVIDLSGDGRETAFREWSVPIDQARTAARALGITINGLAILTDEPDLERYYRTRLITGFGAFAMSAASFEDFAEAMRAKLIREIEHRPVVSQGKARPVPVGLDTRRNPEYSRPGRPERAAAIYERGRGS